MHNDLYLANSIIECAALEHLHRWLQTAKFIMKNSKCVGLAQEIGFSASNSCSLPWLLKGATHLCTSKTECNKLDLTMAEFFWLVDHTDWSRWFAISSPHEYAVPVTFVEFPKKQQLNLDILLSRAPVEMLLCRCAGYWSATGGRQLLQRYLMQRFFSTKFAVFGPKICENFGEFIFLLLIRLIYLSTSGDALSKSLG